jgi:hypothetical protein
MRYRQHERSNLEIKNFPVLVITVLLRCIGTSVSSTASVSSIKGESTPVIENTCWRGTTAQITEIAKAVAQEEEADSDLGSLTSRRIGRILERLVLSQLLAAGVQDYHYW